MVEPITQAEDKKRHADKEIIETPVKCLIIKKGKSEKIDAAGGN